MRLCLDLWLSSYPLTRTHKIWYTKTMKTIKLEVSFTYDNEIMYGTNEEKEWFYNILLNNELFLHENEDIGDTLGTIKIERIIKCNFTNA